MSRQEMVAYGKQEFRRYPLVTLDPLPDQTDIGDYYRRAARFDKCKVQFSSMRICPGVSWG